MGADTKDANTRLPLLDPQGLTPEQRNLYERLEGKWLPWAKESGFEAVTGEGRLLGPFNALLYNEELGAEYLKYLAVERETTELDAVVREVVILTVAAGTNCRYEAYAHAAVAAKEGIGSADTQALLQGEVPSGLNADAIAAQKFVKALVTTHRVPDEVYQEARKAFSHKCLVDLVHLAGLYLATAAMLNAFDVPVPE